METLLRRSQTTRPTETTSIASDRIEFYPDDRDDRVNFESYGSFVIVWVAFPYDRPDRLNIFWDDWDDPDDPDDYMETRLKMSQFIVQMFHAGAVTECAAALLYSLSDTLLVLQVKAEQTITIKIHAKRDDGSVVWHPSTDPRVLRGAMHSG